MNLQEVAQHLEKLNEWSLEGNSIVKSFDFENFSKALEFVNKVGEIAERLEHHPDILINYNKVRIVLSTHSLSGLSEKDFEVAGEIDKIQQNI